MPDTGHGPAADEGRPSVANVPSTIASAGERWFFCASLPGPAKRLGTCIPREEGMPRFSGGPKISSQRERFPFFEAECRPGAVLPGKFSALGLQQSMGAKRSPQGRAKHPYRWWLQCDKLPTRSGGLRISPFLPLLRFPCGKPPRRNGHAPGRIAGRARGRWSIRPTMALVRSDAVRRYLRRRCMVNRRYALTGTLRTGRCFACRFFSTPSAFGPAAGSPTKPS